jgi:hypothetical protein
MKKILVLSIAVLAFSKTYAQNNLSTTGNVGIGTLSPAAALQILRSGVNAGADYPSLEIATNGTGNIYGPILYLNGNSGAGGRRWGLVSSGAYDAPVTGAAGNFAIYDANAGTRMVINSTGLVGIGTNAPTELLSIGNDDGTNPASRKVLQLSSGGYDQPSGFTANSNGDKIILYNSQAAGYDSRIGIGNRGNMWFKSIGPNGSTGMVEWYTGLSDLPKMVLSSSGALSIGTSDPKSYKLAVNGSAIVTSMTVKLNAQWPDFVFRDNYLLKPLAEVKDFIQTNHHLPELPNASDVEKNGLDLGEINRLLVKKVEELTLYAIESEQKNNSQNSSIRIQQKKLSSQEKRIKLLESKLERLLSRSE